MTRLARRLAPSLVAGHGWVDVCACAAVELDRGVAARIGVSQVAIFRVSVAEGKWFALDNRDPVTGANVLARGLVGSVDSVLYVASPMMKHRFAFADGACLDDDRIGVRTWSVRVRAGRVEILVDEPDKQTS